MFAMDRPWWEVHLTKVNEMFQGSRYSTNPLPAKYQTTRLPVTKFKGYGNSGAACISLAAQAGAKRIILIGYDCQKTGGKAHWHGDHPKNLGNANLIARWHGKFAELAKDLKHLTIINASRETALECFPRMTLEEALSEAPQ